MPHPGILCEHRRDLTGFHPDAANLHLRVGSSEVLQRAIGLATHQITGAVHPFPADKRVGDESLHGFGCAVQVAAGQLGAAEVQLPRDAVG